MLQKLILILFINFLNLSWSFTMKGKSLLTLALFAAIHGTSVYALSSENTKLISHKEWSDKNIKGTYTTIKPSAIFTLKLHHYLQNPFDRARFIDASNEIDNMNIRPATQLSSVSGTSELFIVNNSNAPQTFTIRIALCTGDAAMVDMDLLNCNSYQDQIEIDPHGIFPKNIASSMLYAFPKPGDYYVQMSTIILTGNDDEPEFVSETSHNLTVPAA